MHLLSTTLESHDFVEGSWEGIAWNNGPGVGPRLPCLVVPSPRRTYDTFTVTVTATVTVTVTSVVDA